MLLPIHIAAGGLAIVLGAVALSVKKGGTIHRRSGLLFVYAMNTRALPDRGKREDEQTPWPCPRRRSVSHARRDVHHPRISPAALDDFRNWLQLGLEARERE
jgi:hypothetical protein